MTSLRPLLITFVVASLRSLLRSSTRFAVLAVSLCSALYSSFDLLAAPPPELTVLRQQYDKAYAERVTAVHEASVAGLDAKFTTALDNAVATAKANGDLPTVLAIQGDKKILADKQPLPADDDKTPEALKKLRTIYRERLAKLEEQRTALATALLAPYSARLKELEATLTKADRIDEAAEVLAYREGLKAVAPPAAPAIAVGTPTPSTAEVSTSTKSARTFPSGDDRKAALWALDMNVENLNVVVGDKTLYIKAGGDLPEEPFQIAAIRINFISPPRVSYKGIEVLAGLAGLRKLELLNMPITDSDTEVFATLPKLETLNLDQSKAKLTGANLDLLRHQPLTWLSLRGCSNIGNKAAAALAKLTELQSLILLRCDLDDRDLVHLSTLKNLQHLDVGHTRITSKGIASLSGLASLNSLGWTPTPKKATTELKEIATALPVIKTYYLSTDKLLTVEDARGFSAFRELTKVYLERATCTPEVISGISTLPALNYLRIYYAETLKDDGFAELSGSQSLAILEIDNAPLITGATLKHLEKLPGLRKLTLSRCPKIDQPAIDAFKKDRPDVATNK